MSVWRDVQESGRHARRKQADGARGRVTAIGADETAVRVKSARFWTATRRSPPARGAEREVAGAVMPSQAAGRPADEQSD